MKASELKSAILIVSYNSWKVYLDADGVFHWAYHDAINMNSPASARTPGYVASTVPKSKSIARWNRELFDADP